jgi:hypothetical protein
MRDGHRDACTDGQTDGLGSWLRGGIDGVRSAHDTLLRRLAESMFLDETSKASAGRTKLAVDDIKRLRRW